MVTTSITEVGIIGAGVMGEALLSSLLKSGISPANIAIADKREDRLNELRIKFGCGISSASEIAP